MADSLRKKSGKPGLLLAILLLLVMLAVALLWGAYKGWQQELNLVQRNLHQVEERLSLRREAGANLLVVARRHLPAGDPLLKSLKADVDLLAGRGGLAERTAAAASLRQDALTLLSALENTPSLANDSRDSMYVRQLLPQQLEQSAAAGWHDEYNLQADSYNQRLSGSFSGWLARLLGVKSAERLHGEVD